MKRDPAKRPGSTQSKSLPAPGKNDDQEISVADDSAKPSGPFDVRTIKALVALMTEHDLSEINLRDGTQRLRLRRGGPAQAIVQSSSVQSAAPLMAGPGTLKQDPAPAASPPKKLIDIKSQTVGTFYAAPNPGADPFVKLGARVSPASVVGLIEAMKLFNEIQAECSGVVVEILVENQQPVEFGQVLMRVDPVA